MAKIHCEYPDGKSDDFNVTLNLHDAIDLYDPFGWRHPIPLDQAVPYGLAACSIRIGGENDFSDEPDTIPNALSFRSEAA